MKRNLFLTLFLIATLAAKAVGGGFIKGHVYDAKNNEAISFATVVILETTRGVATDAQGNFQMETIDPGFYKLKVSAIGYKTYITESFRVTKAVGAQLDIPLEEETVSLNEVVIRPSDFRKKEESPLSLRTISIEEIEKNPGGNRDISKVIQSYPGVASSSAYRNDLIVRGGGPSENRFYLDGVEIPNLNHFATQGASGGPVGIINIDFIREVNFYSGAFPASRGNALSSVLEFSQREASDRFKFRGTVGASDMALAIEGPLNKTTTYMASVRRSYLQFLFRAIGLPFLPTYNDFQFKIKSKLNAKTELSVIGLGSLDQSVLNTSANKTEEQRYILGFLPENNQWSYTLGVVLKHFKPRGYDTYVLSQNKLDNGAIKYSENIVQPQNLMLDYLSYEMESKFRYEHNYRSASEVKINYGVDLQYVSYFNRTFQKSYLYSIPVDLKYRSVLDFTKYAFFGQVSHPFWDRSLELSFGLRGDGNGYSSRMKNPFEQLSPRLSASYRLSPGTSLNFSMGRFAQLPPYTTLGYRDFTGGLVNRELLNYIRVNHLVAGVEFRPSDHSQVTVEGFYKHYSSYPISLNDSVSLASKGADYGVYGVETVVPIGLGRAYGIEAMGKIKQYKKLSAVVTYTLVRSEFTNHSGAYIASSWDNRHLMTLTATRNLKRNWDVGMKWRYIGGAPYTPWDMERSALKSAWDAQGSGYLDYSKFNQLRLRAFHQLDIRIDKAWYYNAWSLMLYLDVQNAYNFKADQPDYLVRKEDSAGNPLTDPTNPAKYLLKTISSSAGNAIPTIGIMVEF